jgi:hypothetical protein
MLVTLGRALSSIRISSQIFDLSPQGVSGNQTIALMSNRINIGTVNVFNMTKGIGYVRRDDVGVDVIVHILVV